MFCVLFPLRAVGCDVLLLLCGVQRRRLAVGWYRRCDEDRAGKGRGQVRSSASLEADAERDEEAWEDGWESKIVEVDSFA